MTGNDFQNDTFDGIDANRHLSLILFDFTNLGYLKEDAFLPLLKRDNFTLSLIGSPMGFYKQNKWLFDCKDSLNLTTKFEDLTMIDYSDLFSHDKSEFNVTSPL